MGRTTTHQSDRLPERMHATLEDAIFVTKGLGYKYLWVDQYSINQEAGDIYFTQQLKEMGRIYHDAAVTIIAAAGPDATYGLPGINTTTRMSCVRLRSGPSILSTTPTSLRKAVESSVWNTRAWTYQEALFSRRRLIFTSERAILQCRDSCWYASEPQIEGQRTADNFAVPFLTKVGSHHNYTHMAANCIEAFSGRVLSNQYDVLKACGGLLQAFQDVWRLNLWGVLELYLDSSLSKSQSPSNHLVREMKWRTGQKCKRRAGFPSWSWAGWDGEVKYARERLEMDHRIQVSVELEDGTNMNWSQVREMLQGLSEQPTEWTQFIHMKACCAPLTLAPEQEEHDPYVVVMCTETSLHEITFHLPDRLIPDGSSIDPSCEFLAVLLGPPDLEESEWQQYFHSVVLSNEIDIFIILVVDRGGFYERVGQYSNHFGEGSTTEQMYNLP